MISQLKLLILINWQEDGNWSFLHILRNVVNNVHILQPVSFSNILSNRLNRISHYFSEFYVPLMAFFSRKRIDVIISWQMRLGISYGILKRMVHHNRPPIHVIQDFHIDLTQKQWLYRVQLALMKLAIPGIDYFFCTSTEEEKIYNQMFGIDRSRICFMPLIAPMSYFQEPAHPQADYVFSYGNSDRDFDVLIRAVTHLDIKTYILSKRYVPRTPLPQNVSILRDRVPEKKLIDWIASSRMVVLPLKDYRISAGQLSMLEVMALGRPLIITENMATKEYAIHQQSALFFKAGSDRELAEQIKHLWSHRDLAEQIGQKARQASMKLNDVRMAVFMNVLKHCAMDNMKGEHR